MDKGYESQLTVLDDFLDAFCYCLGQLLHLSGWPIGGGGRVARHDCWMHNQVGITLRRL